MKNQISSKIGILIIILFSLIVLLVIGINFLDLKFFSINEEKRDFEVTDFLSDEIYCDILYNDIKFLLDENNFCTDNDDCKALALNDRSTGDNCYFYINKDVDETIFHDKFLDYKGRCEKSITECNSSLNLLCINERCVSGENM